MWSTLSFHVLAFAPVWVSVPRVRLWAPPLLRTAARCPAVTRSRTRRLAVAFRSGG